MIGAHNSKGASMIVHEHEYRFIGKQRNGETGTAPMLWNAQTTRFFGVEEYVRERG